MSDRERLVYRNPVIPGFYPDPSAIRVGRDYYLVTSSFEYFPGVPIFHSTNLIEWRQIGHVITRTEQVDLSQSKSSGGIFAPALRWHRGTFYMVTTDTSGIGNFYVTATDPAGPWSDPIRLPYGNIDPSLFFDDDGKVYVTAQNGWGHESHIIQYEINPQTGEALTEPVNIWQDPEGPWTEGPHLYKINGMYYIMSATGGTAYDHREIIGRSPNPYGPFEPCPVPILTHRGLPGHEIQCTGHAELIDDPDGNWWALFLGTRPLEGKYSVLGRETFLAPVRWTEDGWPMIDNNEGTVRTIMQVPDSAVFGSDSASGTESRNPYRQFGQEPLSLTWPLAPEWSFLRTSDPERYSWDSESGRLKLVGNRWTLDDEAPATFLCIRQKHFRMRVTVQMDYTPVHEGEEAGLAVRLSNRGYVFWGIKKTGEGVRLCLSQRNGDDLVRRLIDPSEPGGSTGGLAGERIHLSVASDGKVYRFAFSADGTVWHSPAEEVPMAHLSTEVNGGFTGACAGLYASGAGADSSAPARFSQFVYTPEEE